MRLIYIYPYLVDFYGKLVGKYTNRPMGSYWLGSIHRNTLSETVQQPPLGSDQFKGTSTKGGFPERVTPNPGGFWTSKRSQK